jgi:hypothetical protein
VQIRIGRRRSVSAARGLSSLGDARSQRHDDLAAMLVGVHVLEGLADVVEGKVAVDRQLQFALLH